MAGASLLTLLDDIASVLDDVAALTKVATRKTAGVLGDDLALNAQQVSGVTANRELPVVWAVAKGSAVNKAILVPSALAISALAPWLVTPLLMAGGTFLCYEGFEKVVHKLRHPDAGAARRAERVAALADPVVDLVAVEKDKVKGAIRTDFILSAEIVVITLGTVADAAFGTQVAVLVGIAALMTVGVYGLVAGIVKLDDAGLYLSREGGSAWVRSVGRGILGMAPWLMKGLAIAGTAAMFLVGGSIIAHGIPALHHLGDIVAAWASSLQGVGPATGVLASLLVNATVGVATGALALGTVSLFSRLRRATAARDHDQPMD